MNSAARTASLMILVLIIATLVGCVTFFPLDPYLDKAIGQKTGEIIYPQLKHQKLVKQEGSRVIVQYSIDALWRCRWEFEIEKDSGLIRAWRYPDADAARYCRELPSSRP